MDIIAGMHQCRSFVKLCHDITSRVIMSDMTTMATLRGRFHCYVRKQRIAVRSVGQITEGVRAGVSIGVTGRSLQLSCPGVACGCGFACAR